MKKQILLENVFQPTILCKKQVKQVLGIDEHLICFAKKNARTTLHATQIVFNFHAKKNNMYDITFVNSTLGKKSKDQNVTGS